MPRSKSINKSRRKRCPRSKIRNPKTGRCVLRRSSRGSTAKKYERCVRSVKRRQPKRCSPYYLRKDGCYNPWAVCRSSVLKQRSRKRKQSRKRRRRK